MSSPRTFSELRYALAILVTGSAILAIAQGACAAVKTWDGDDTNNPTTPNSNWTDGVNWDNNTAPNTGDSLVFAGSIGLAPIDDYPDSTLFNGISFAANAGAFTLSGGSQINLGGDIVNASTNLQTIAAIPLALQQSINVNATGNIAIGGVVSGAGFGLTKLGAGNLTLSGANTYTGGTSLNAGTLTLSTNNGAAGTGAITFNGGNLAFADARTITNPLVMTSNGTVFAATANNNNQLSGAITGTGVLSINIPNNVNQTFTLGNNTNSVSAFAGTIDLGTSVGIFRFNSGGSTIGFGNSNLSINLGTGTATMRARNSGAADVITIGALTGGVNTSIIGGTSGSGTATYTVGGLNTNTTFDGTLRNSLPTGVTGALVGTVSLVKVGTGSLTLTNTSNSYAGTTTVGTATAPGGVLVARGDGTLGNSPTITINVGSQLTLMGGATNNYISDLANIILAATDGTNPNGIVNLNFTGAPDSVTSLTINGTALNPGIYTATSPETTGYLFGTGSLSVGVVPEPSTWAMMLCGLGMLAMVRRSRRQQQAA